MASTVAVLLFCCCLRVVIAKRGYDECGRFSCVRFGLRPLFAKQQALGDFVSRCRMEQFGFRNANRDPKDRFLISYIYMFDIK